MSAAPAIRSAVESLTTIHAAVEAKRRELTAELDEEIRRIDDALRVLAPSEPAAAEAPKPKIDTPKPVDATYPVAKPAKLPATKSPLLQPRMPVQTRAEVFDFVRNAGAPVSKQDIITATGLSEPQVSRRLAQLVGAGKLVATGATKSRRWSMPRNEAVAAAAYAAAGIAPPKPAIHPSKPGKLRLQVRAAVTNDPGALTTQRLATFLREDVNDIVEAVEWLEDRGLIQTRPDGTYVCPTPVKA